MSEISSCQHFTRLSPALSARSCRIFASLASKMNRPVTGRIGPVTKKLSGSNSVFDHIQIEDTFFLCHIKCFFTLITHSSNLVLISWYCIIHWYIHVRNQYLNVYKEQTICIAEMRIHAFNWGIIFWKFQIFDVVTGIASLVHIGFFTWKFIFTG